MNTFATPQVFTMHLILANLLLARVIHVHPTPLTSDYQVKERHPLPYGWTRQGDADSSQTIELQVVLKQRRFEELEQHVVEISDPSHARYGQHLSKDEVNALSGSDPKALEEVLHWLDVRLENGLGESKYRSSGNILSIALPISHAEALLDTKFDAYRHEDGSTLTRTLEWKLPLHLHDHIDTIQPTTSFVRHVPPTRAWVGGETRDISTLVGRRDADQRTTIEQACNTSAITPLCLRTLVSALCTSRTRMRSVRPSSHNMPPVRDH